MDLVTEALEAMFLVIVVGWWLAVMGTLAMMLVVILARMLPARWRAAVVRGVHSARDMVHGVVDMIAEP